MTKITIRDRHNDGVSPHPIEEHARREYTEAGKDHQRELSTAYLIFLLDLALWTKKVGRVLMRNYGLAATERGQGVETWMCWVQRRGCVARRRTSTTGCTYKAGKVSVFARNSRSRIWRENHLSELGLSWDSSAACPASRFESSRASKTYWAIWASEWRGALHRFDAVRARKQCHLRWRSLVLVL